MFQLLRHAPNGERKRRGLFFSGSFAEHVTKDMVLDLYALDMEGRGYSRPDEDPMGGIYMTRGLAAVVTDVIGLLGDVCRRHGFADNSRIFLLGHSTGSLSLTRVVQRLARGDLPGGDVGGFIATSPLYGMGKQDGSGIFLNSMGKVSRRLWRSFLNCLACIAPWFMLTSAHVSERRDRRDMSNIDPRIIEKSISPGQLIERWVSSDREMDPLFVAPFTPLRMRLAASLTGEIIDAWRDVASISVPFFILHSRFDPLLSFHCSQRFLDAVASRDTLLESPAGVVLHNPQLEEEGRDEVNARIYERLEQRMDLTPS
mmetsp:Transcript_29190/g.93456  ORF Transcript_29190/g.93456 Transcript_29190/m.93456 type:complete len:315 (-) Transcript_29190:1990-2934(-)